MNSITPICVQQKNAMSLSQNPNALHCNTLNQQDMYVPSFKGGAQSIVSNKKGFSRMLVAIAGSLGAIWGGLKLQEGLQTCESKQMRAKEKAKQAAYRQVDKLEYEDIKCSLNLDPFLRDNAIERIRENTMEIKQKISELIDKNPDGTKIDFEILGRESILTELSFQGYMPLHRRDIRFKFSLKQPWHTYTYSTESSRKSEWFPLYWRINALSNYIGEIDGKIEKMQDDMRSESYRLANDIPPTFLDFWHNKAISLSDEGQEKFLLKKLEQERSKRSKKNIGICKKLNITPDDDIAKLNSNIDAKVAQVKARMTNK